LSRAILNFGLMTDDVGSVSAVYKVFSIDTSVVAPAYVESYMRARPGFFKRVLNSSSREGQSVSSQQVLATELLIPPPSVRHCFEAITGAIITGIGARQSEAATLAALRDTLLPKLISGELRIADAKRIVERAV